MPTRSIGLLSYTFLMETGCDDVLVPTVSLTYSFSADRKFCQVELIFSSSCLVTLCCHAVLQVDYQYDPTTASYCIKRSSLEMLVHILIDMVLNIMANKDIFTKF